MSDQSNQPTASRSARRQPTMTAEQLAIEFARATADMRCEDVVLLDVRGLSPVTDFFLIATGTSDRQMRAIAEALDDRARMAGHRRYGICGTEGGTWILMDYVDLVIHLFSAASRVYYDLELLWGDAPRIDWKADA
jgi:ribosome-associated protein